MQLGAWLLLGLVALVVLASVSVEGALAEASSPAPSSPSPVPPPSPTCPSNCTNHGVCVAGRCLCNAGWTGAACASRTSVVRCLPHPAGISFAPLPANTLVHGAIGSSGSEWLYYNVTLPSLSNPGAYVAVRAG